MSMDAAPIARPCRAVCRGLREPCVRGFTLIELIMVMLLVGILAAYAVPRIFNRAVFDARGMHDMTMAYLRYAQKTAIAQRRTVCVAFTANGMALRIANNAGATDCAAGAALNGPDGNPGLAGPVNYTATPNNMAFDALGQPLSGVAATLGTVLNAATAINVVGAGRTVTVEAGTGYVHDN